MTGISNSRMKRFRLSGSTVLETCSAETTVPWMTSRSSSAARMAGASSVGALGGDRGRRGDARLLHLADPLGHQLGLDRLGVHLLHPGGGLLVVELADLVEQGGRVLVAGPEPLEVEDAQPAEAAQLDGRVRADHAVHGRRQQRQVEAVGVDLPGDVDVLGVAGPAAGHDGDVVEPVGPAPRLEDADLDLCHMPALRPSSSHRPSPGRHADVRPRYRRRPDGRAPVTAGSAAADVSPEHQGRPARRACGRWRPRRSRRPPRRTTPGTSRRPVAPGDRAARHRPALLGEDAVGRQVGQGHVEDPLHLGRVGRERRAGGRAPPPPARSATLEEKVTSGSEPARPAAPRRGRGPPPRPPPAGRPRAGLSPGSMRPPGKLTSPRWARRRARAPGEHDPGLAGLLEERHQHGRGAPGVGPDGPAPAGRAPRGGPAPSRPARAPPRTEATEIPRRAAAGSDGPGRRAPAGHRRSGDDLGARAAAVARRSGRRGGVIGPSGYGAAPAVRDAARPGHVARPVGSARSGPRRAGRLHHPAHAAHAAHAAHGGGRRGGAVGLLGLVGHQGLGGEQQRRRSTPRSAAPSGSPWPGR